MRPFGVVKPVLVLCRVAVFPWRQVLGVDGDGYPVWSLDKVSSADRVAFLVLHLCRGLARALCSRCAGHENRQQGPDRHKPYRPPYSHAESPSFSKRSTVRLEVSYALRRKHLHAFLGL